MISRRQFLKTSALAGGSLILRWRGVVRRASAAQTLLDASTLTKFVDPLPIPSVLQPVRWIGRVPHYEVSMSEFQQQLHSELPPTTVWGYNGHYPGPTLEAHILRRIAVTWINNLPSEHLLPVDTNLHGAEDPPNPPVRVVPHLHGGHTPTAFDGNPEYWFTNDPTAPANGRGGPVGNSATYIYPNTQRGATLWYHDHALGITRLNVYAGLAGFYLLREALEARLNLPAGPYEIPLVMQDRLFNDDGSLYYPVRDPSIVPTSPQHPGPWVPEAFGDVALVNGKVWPHLDVEPRKYRFRILNGSNARFYNLKFDSGLPFHQIGTDGGLLPTPVTLAEILLAPAERADVIVDFTGTAGATFTLTNDAPAPFPAGGDIGLPQIMQFRVIRPLSGPDTSSLPSGSYPIHWPEEQAAIRARDLLLEEKVDEADEPIELLVNGEDYDDPVTETPRLGTVEVWRLINLTGDAHPIHLHLVQFRVLDRQALLSDGEDGFLPQPDPAAPRVPPDANEMGRKDTVRANPGEVTRILACFNRRGRYVFHCHILEHEDNSMMRPYEVV